MISLDDLKRTIRHNKLLGMWAAKNLGGADAEAYSDALAGGTVDPERSDVCSKIRKDFDAAGAVQSDEQILRVMNELLLQAADQTQATQGGGVDAAAVMIARNLTTRRAGPYCDAYGSSTSVNGDLDTPTSPPTPERIAALPRTVQTGQKATSRGRSSGRTPPDGHIKSFPALANQGNPR
jgi:hypothetical protein